MPLNPNQPTNQQTVKIHIPDIFLRSLRNVGIEMIQLGLLYPKMSFQIEMVIRKLVVRQVKWCGFM